MLHFHFPGRASRAVILGMRTLIGLVLIVGLLPWSFHQSARVAQAASTSVFFNEFHYDNAGTDTGEAIEIAGPAGTDLTGWKVTLYNGSGGASYGTQTLSGTLPNSCSGLGVMTISTPGLQNGSPDGFALSNASGTLVQFLSYEGTFTASGGPADGQTSTDVGLSEGSSTPEGYSLQLTGTGQYYEDFTWTGPTTATFGACNTGQTYTVTDIAPTVSSTDPTDGATGVALSANVTVTFSEAVTVSGDWFVMNCTVSGNRAPSLSNVGVSGGPTTYTIDPNSNFQYGDVCAVTIYASQVVDQDGAADNMASNYPFGFSPLASDPCETFTPIYDIQGSGASSPLVGQTLTTRGVVTGDFQGSTQRSGYFIQDSSGDMDPATSDGVFVYDNTNVVSPGDLVLVSGKVQEFSSLTEIGSVTNVTMCGTGSVGSTTVNLPMPSSATPDDFWEPFEGMLITIPQQLTVTEIYELGRYGQALLSSGGRLWQFTHTDLPSVAGYTAHLEDNARRSIKLDDHSSKQNPNPEIHPDPRLMASNTLRGGDSVTALTGVLNYTYGDWVIDPVDVVNFDHTNPRTAAPASTGGSVTVASFNVLNYFSTIDTGAAICGPLADQDCRGADSAAEFTRQRDKIFSALAAIDADVVGLMEIENNASQAAIQDLVNGLNAVVGAGTYDYIPAGPIGGDAIQVALIYKPATVTPVGAYAVLDSVAPFNDNTRPPLVQTFEEIASGETFTVVVNHFKSKGCPTPSLPPSDPNADQGDGQSCYNADRVEAANALSAWLATDPTGSGDTDFLIIGDLNSYAREDPVVALEGAGYTNLIRSLNGAADYSYVYDGEWGYLDHALSSASLVSQVASVSHWHINADEPLALDYNTEYKTTTPYDQITEFYSSDAYRASDHDPVLVGLNLSTTAESGTSSSAEPALNVFDPALSKIGVLPEGGIGLPGEQLTWTVTLTNSGGAAGTNVVITDVVRSELRVDSADTGRGTVVISGQTVTFTIPTIDPGETVVMHVYTTVLSSPLAGAFTNEVALSGSDASGSVVTTSAVGTVLVAEALPATGYPPAESSSSGVTPALWAGLIGVLALTLAGSGWLLRRRVR